MGFLEINFSLFIKQSLNCGCFVCFNLELLPKLIKSYWGTEGTQDDTWGTIYNLIQLFY